MREQHRWGDQFPTITLSLTKGATTDAEKWRGWIPLNTLTFDGTGTPAYIGAVLDIGFGNVEAPLSGVSIRQISDTGLSDPDPRKCVRPGIMIEVEIDAGTDAFTEIPLLIYCLGLATDGPEVTDITLPSVVSNSTDWTVKDRLSGTVPSYWIQIVESSTAIDAVKKAAIEWRFENGGSALVAGNYGDIKLPFDCEIISWSLMANQVGSLSVDVKKSTGSYPGTTSLCTGVEPTIVTDDLAEDATLAGWTTTLTEGDFLRFSVISATTITGATLMLQVQRG